MQPSQQFDPKDLELTFKTVTVSNDGQATILNNAIDGAAVINFFQIRPPKDGKPQADVVASVSFPHMVAFEKFVKDMQNNLDEHKKRKNN